MKIRQIYHAGLMRLLSHTLLLLVFFSPSVEGKSLMIAPAVVAAGIGLLGTGGQIFAQGKMNKKTREWNEKMYGIQRRDALSDWQMQNAYNSPEQQMQRLQAAGLNPNLVYGNGAEAMSTQGPRSSDTGSWNPQAPNWAGIGQGVADMALGYAELKSKTAQTDNIKAQNDLIKAQIQSQTLDNIKKNLTYSLEADAANASNSATAKNAQIKAQYELDNLHGTYQNLQEDLVTKANQQTLIRNQTQNTITQRKVMLDENDRAWIMNANNTKEVKARIVSMAYANAKSDAERRLIIQNAKTEKFNSAIKALDFENQRKNGGKSSDSWFYRNLDKALDELQSFSETLY